MLQKLRNSPHFGWFLLAILALIWGSSFILIKKGLLAFSAAEVGALRIVAAFAFLVPVAIPALHRLTARHFGLLLLIGLVGSLGPSFMFALAQTQLSSSATGILNAVTPLNVLLIGAAFFHKTITKKEVIGLGIGFLGAVMLTLAGSEGFGSLNYYALLVVLATICYGFNLNIIKNYLGDLKPIVITGVSLLLVGPAAAVYLFGMSEFWTKAATDVAWWPMMAVVCLGVVGTAIALILFNKLVQIRTAVFASSVTYLIPIVAIGWGVVDNESLTYQHFVGMGAILGGVYVANRL